MTEGEPAPVAGSPRYSAVAIALHWAIAGLLVFQIGLGLRMEAAQGPAKFAAFQLHKSVGITILLLAVLRLLWRFLRTPPALTAKGWERGLAHAVHWLFYLLLFALPISGWIIISTSRIAVPTLLFGTIPWPHLPGLSGLQDTGKAAWHTAGTIAHHGLLLLIYLLFALHVAGALKHHFIDRDGEIGRMAPGTRAGSWFDPRLILIAIGVIAAAGLGLAWLPMGPVRPVASTEATAALTPVAAAPAAAPSSAPATPTVAAPAEGNPALLPEAKASSWRISKGSTLRFRTSWSGDTIDGGFNRFDGDIDFDPLQLDRARVEIKIDMNSAFSGDAQRDETLKSPDWFSVGSYGTATFKAVRFSDLGGGRYVARGTLRLKGATLPISLPFTLAIKGDEATMSGTTMVDRIAYKVGEGDYASTSEIPAAVKVAVQLRATRKN